MAYELTTEEYCQIAANATKKFKEYTGGDVPFSEFISREIMTHYGKLLTAKDDEIKKLKEPTQWVKIEEGCVMPKDGVTVYSWNGVAMHEDFFFENKWHINSGLAVTHWTPKIIPTPPTTK